MEEHLVHSIVHPKHSENKNQAHERDDSDSTQHTGGTISL